MSPEGNADSGGTLWAAPEGHACCGTHGLHGQLALRPAVGGRRHRRVARPCARPRACRPAQPRPRARRWPTRSTSRRPSWPPVSSSSHPATRTSTLLWSAASPNWPAPRVRGSTPLVAATIRRPATCACSSNASLAQVARGVLILQQVLAERATEAGDARLPAYTHLQRAQACCWRTICWPTAGRSPRRRPPAGRPPARRRVALGCWRLRRHVTPHRSRRHCADLGFSARFENSLDAVSDRDFVAESLFALALLGVHLSRLGEEIVWWGQRGGRLRAPRRRLGDG